MIFSGINFPISLKILDLLKIYKQWKQRFDDDPEFVPLLSYNLMTQNMTKDGNKSVIFPKKNKDTTVHIIN